MQKKLITVSVPVYNEELNIRPAYERIRAVMEGLTDYRYEIVFFDDGSTDGSRKEIEALCIADPAVKAVFYTRNFGYAKTVFYCAQQARGDACILVHCDLQNPPEEIPRLVEKWEQGADAVITVKNKSRENPFAYFLRTVCYWLANVLFGMHLVPHSTEFELLDKSLIVSFADIRTQAPFLRGLILKNAKHIEKVYYTQDKRARGKSHFSLSKYYEFAVGAMVNMSKRCPRRLIVFSLCGLLALALEFFIAFVPGIPDLSRASLIGGILLHIGIALLLGSLIVLALIWEYVIVLREDLVASPLITEEKRINFDSDEKDPA